VTLRRLFALSSLAFLIVLAFSPVKNALRPYRALQRQFRLEGIARASSAKASEIYASRPIAIEQIWLPELNDHVDRCTTCHLGVADAAMTNAPQPFRTHPPTFHTPRDIQRFGCTACHGGEGLATDQTNAHGTSPDATTPILPADFIEAGCGRCHDADTVRDAPTLSSGRALMAKSNCFACHKARGHEDFRADAPSLDTLPMKTGAEWLRRWLSDPKAVDANATMPNFQLSSVEIKVLSHYLFGRTVPPQLQHAIDLAGAEPPGDSARGKTLFAESRCISCHTVDGWSPSSAIHTRSIRRRKCRGTRSRTRMCATSWPGSKTSCGTSTRRRTSSSRCASIRRSAKKEKRCSRVPAASPATAA